MVNIENLKRLVAYRIPNMPFAVEEVDDKTVRVMVEVGPKGHRQGCLVNITSVNLAASQILRLSTTINKNAA